jgi:uncharacterized RDD family membrane protein YckC
VDGLIIYGLLRLACATFLPSVTQRLLGEHPSTSAVIAIVWTPLSLLVLLYDGFLLSSFGGATLGKRLFRLRVVDAQGAALSTTRAWIRAAIKSLFFFTPLPLLPGALVPLLSRQRRAAHDWLAGSLVVDARPTPAGSVVAPS